MNEQEFGSKIKARREELGISQQDVAIAIGLDQGKVSLIEKGMRRVDSVKELPLLARVLKCPLGWFYEGENIPQQKTPIEALVNQYFPDVEFTEFQMKRIAQFMEPVIQSYVNTDPELGKKLSNS